MGDSVVYLYRKTMWPSGLRRQLQALVRKGEGSNPSAIILFIFCSILIFSATNRNSRIVFSSGNTIYDLVTELN